MKRRWLPLFVGLVLIALIGFPLTVHAQPSARKIIERADEQMRGETVQGVQSMEIIRPDWSRKIRFRYWLDGENQAFIRVLEPSRMEGTAFLKIEDQMWQFEPRINRVIKIPPSMMMQSWLGSDFTNDDLVRESSIVGDYTHELIGTDTLRGMTAYHLRLEPRQAAAVTWGRVEYWVRTDDYVPLKAVYFNQRGERSRTLSFENIERMGGRQLPTRLVMTDHSNTGHQTVLRYEEMTFNEPIDDRIFSRQNLQRSR